MKVSAYRIGWFILLPAVFALFSGMQPSAAAQTPPDKSTSPTINKAEPAPPSAGVPQQGETDRERRARAYAKLLEGQRHLSELRRGANATVLQQARDAFQQAATLDPNLAEAHTALAEIAFYYPPQDFETAAREGAKAIRINPENFGARRILSRLYTIKSGLREGRLNKEYVELAIKELSEVARLDRNNAEAWAFLGEFHLVSGRTAEAVEAFTRWSAAASATDTRFYQYITNRELSSDTASARLGEALLAAGRPNEALAAISRAIALDQGKSEEYGALLAQAIESGGIEDKLAIAELQRIIAANPGNVATIELLARVQARSGAVDDAVATLRAAIARQPKGEREQLMLRTTLAQLYIDALRHSEAIGVYEEQLKARGIADTALTNDEDKLFAGRLMQRMIEIHKRAGRPNDAAATIERMRRLLGKDDPSADLQQILLLRYQGKRNEALQAIWVARQRYPEQSGFLQLEAQTLADLGRVDEGVALLRPLLKGSIEDFEQYLVISNLYLQSSRAPDAVLAARKALDLAPAERPDLIEAALVTLSSAQERAGDAKGSEESLRKILARDPNNATALNNLGYFLVERNERLAEALEMIQRAVRSSPTNASFQDSLGWAYFKLGRLDDAERHLVEAARRNSQSVAIHEHLGDLYQRLGKPDMARAAWQKALAVGSENTDAARIRAKLSGKTPQ